MAMGEIDKYYQILGLNPGVSEEEIKALADFLGIGSIEFGKYLQEFAVLQQAVKKLPAEE
jgi:hypothetical protein